MVVIMLKIIYELFLCFKDIKAYENTKTLKRDNNTDLNKKYETLFK